MLSRKRPLKKERNFSIFSIPSTSGVSLDNNNNHSSSNQVRTTKIAFTKTKLEKLREKSVKTEKLQTNSFKPKVTTTQNSKVSIDSTLEGYSDSDSSIEETGITKPLPIKPSIKIETVQANNEKHKKEQSNKTTCHRTDSVMTKTSKVQKAVCFSENKVIGRWDASGLHDKNLDYNDIVNEKYGKKPSGAELACGKFGKPSKDRSFTADVVFDHVLIHLYKSNLLTETETKRVREVHPLFDHLAKIMNKTLHIDFSSIAEEDYNWNSQEKIPDEMNKKFLAAAIYYDFRLGNIMRFAGNNYTAEYRDVPTLMKKLDGIAPDYLKKQIKDLFEIGAPTKMMGHSSRENFKRYYDYGNHASVLKNPELIEKALNKEHKYKYVMCFPGWISRFVPHLHVTPQGIVIKPGKKDRIIFDASIKLDYDSYCINMATDKNNEPDILYGEAFMKHLIRIWNLRISYPDQDIYVWDDDVSGAFRQGKYNPDIATAFAFIIFNMLWIPCGTVFGSNTSPGNFEPIAMARMLLAQHYSCDKFDYLKEKHKHILDKVDFQYPSNDKIDFVQAVGDSKHKGIFKKNGRRDNTPHFMFVDDNHMADILPYIKQSMAGSIESIFDILGFPEIKVRRDPISWDKYNQHKCSWRKDQLGLTVDTRQMTVELPDKKLHDLTEMISHWHSGRRSFTLLQISRLLGKLEFVANVAPWLRFLLISLRDSSIKALKKNRKLVLEGKTIGHYLQDSLYKGCNSTKLLKKYFAAGKIAQKIWQLNTRFFITKEMKQDLAHLEYLFVHKKTYLKIPIAHWIPRDPDFSGRGDACLEGAGGYSTDLKFWWFIEWPDDIKQKTLKHWNFSVRLDKENFISINLLEYFTVIIMYAAATQAVRDLENFLHKYPIFKNESDNISAVVWTKKASMSSPAGKAMAKIFSLLCINNNLGLSSAYIKGEDNIIADNISRMKTKKLTKTSTELLQTFPELQTCRRFHPNRELVYSLYYALLNGQVKPGNLPANLGHFSPAQNIGNSFVQTTI